MSSQGLLVPLLGVVSILAVVALGMLVRVWPRRPDLSAEERAEMADRPMPVVQKAAWVGLGIGVATLAVIAMILTNRGAMAYWENDDLRLMLLGIFFAGRLGSAGVMNLPLARLEARRKLDERDRAVLARAPTAQMALVVIGVAAWVFMLTRMFRDEGAVPVVYLYLMFGCVILLMMVGQSLGILVGYRVRTCDGEG